MQVQVAVPGQLAVQVVGLRTHMLVQAQVQVALPGQLAVLVVGLRAHMVQVQVQGAVTGQLVILVCQGSQLLGCVKS